MIGIKRLLSTIGALALGHSCDRWSSRPCPRSSCPPPAAGRSRRPVQVHPGRSRSAWSTPDAGGPTDDGKDAAIGRRPRRRLLAVQVGWPRWGAGQRDRRRPQRHRDRSRRAGLRHRLSRRSGRSRHLERERRAPGPDRRQPRHGAARQAYRSTSTRTWHAPRRRRVRVLHAVERHERRTLRRLRSAAHHRHPRRRIGRLRAGRRETRWCALPADVPPDATAVVVNITITDGYAGYWTALRRRLAAAEHLERQHRRRPVASCPTRRSCRSRPPASRCSARRAAT